MYTGHTNDIVILRAVSHLLDSLCVLPFGNDQTLVTVTLQAAADSCLCACSLPTPRELLRSAGAEVTHQSLGASRPAGTETRLVQESLGFSPSRTGVQERPRGPRDPLSFPAGRAGTHFFLKRAPAACIWAIGSRGSLPFPRPSAGHSNLTKNGIPFPKTLEVLCFWKVRNPLLNVFQEAGM